ncbi:MAG: restriction endonuclease subunit S [Bacteroidota bacterium]
MISKTLKNNLNLPLDSIPKGWKITQIKRVCKKITDGAHTSPDRSSEDFPFLSVVNLNDGVLDFKNCLYTSKTDFESLVRNGCRPPKKSVLFSKDGTIGETVVIDEKRDFVVASSFIIVVPDLKLISPKFLKYFLSSSTNRKLARASVKGTGLPRLSIFNFSLLWMAIPSLPEQFQIARYLDEKTAAIDRKIELLEQKEKRYRHLLRSLINETICKGLDKSIRLKDSGITWVGEVPEHWEVKRGKDIFIEKSRKGHGDKPLLAASQKKGVVLKSLLDQRSMEAQKDFGNFKLVKVNDFVISLRSFEGGFEIAYYEGIISPAYTVFSLKDELFPTYFQHLFKTEQFVRFLQSLISGIRDGQTIRYTEVQKAFFPIPDNTEQKGIAQYLDDKSEKINSIIHNIAQQIYKLKALRKSLINEVVTGQRRVTKQLPS